MRGTFKNTMTTLPEQVIIAGHTIKVRRGKLDEFGIYEHDNHTIWISDIIRDTPTLIDTLRHEMMHATLSLCGISFSEHYDEEPIVRALEQNFFPAWDQLNTP